MASDKSIVSLKMDHNLGEALRGLQPDVLLRAVTKGMDNAAPHVIADITKKRLTGKGPFPVADHKLGVKTGRLRQSLRATPAKVEGSEVVLSIGSAVKYAAVHEFGFAGTVQVKAHTRNLSRATKPKAKGKKGKGKRTSREKAGASTTEPKASAMTVKVKAHQRTVNIPERAPVRHGLADAYPILEEEIAKEITNLMSGE